jgi:predicted short-subunit dehydrogenase-like oxidoreductase (DUF2520 family)
MKLGLVGRGRAARTLAPALRATDLELSWWWSRDSAEAPERLPTVDTVLFAVSDSAIEAAAQTMAGRKAAHAEVWLHLSGSRPGDAVRVSPACPGAAGSFHPLQALPGFQVPPSHFIGCVAGLDGEGRAIDAGRAIANALGMRPVSVTPGTRPLYHAAAVSVAGHATALLSQAMRVMSHAGFSRQEARDALLPLMRGALDNLSTALPHEVVTGPVARGDAATVAAHLAALDTKEPEAAEAYRALAKEALRLSTSVLTGPQVDELAKALSPRED